MNVRIVEAGQQKLSFCIDHFCVGTAPPVDCCIRTDRDDAISKHRHGLCEEESCQPSRLCVRDD